ELDNLIHLAESLDQVPPEADQLQSLYDQVDAKHKTVKGVFGYFHDKYGGNARRFVVERRAQYAKYVSETEAQARMMEDLHKLIDQSEKELNSSPNVSGKANDKQSTGPASHGRSFFQG